ncbi:hypothetical protein Tco_1099014 [Tanacetum coccineum]
MWLRFRRVTLEKQADQALSRAQENENVYIVAFKVLETQFQMFIKSRFYLDDEYVDMTRNKFLQYTRLDIPEFRDTLIQHMEFVKKLIGERAQHKMEYESRVNERQIQTIEENTDTSNALDALDASSVIIESNGTESKEHDTSSRSGNDAHVDDAIRPIYDEEPMVEVQMTADDNVSAIGQQHTEQPELNNDLLSRDFAGMLNNVHEIQSFTSGYHQKDRKPSQNDKTEHGMEKTVQNQGQSLKMPKSESILKNTVGCNLNPSDGPGKPNVFFEVLKTMQS